MTTLPPEADEHSKMLELLKRIYDLKQQFETPIDEQALLAAALEDALKSNQPHLLNLLIDKFRYHIINHGRSNLESSLPRFRAAISAAARHHNRSGPV